MSATWIIMYDGQLYDIQKRGLKLAIAGPANLVQGPPAMTVKVEVTGLSELQATLSKLPGVLQEKLGQQALSAAAAVIQEEVRSRAACPPWGADRKHRQADHCWQGWCCASSWQPPPEHHPTPRQEGQRDHHPLRSRAKQESMVRQAGGDWQHLCRCQTLHAVQLSVPGPLKPSTLSPTA